MPANVLSENKMQVFDHEVNYAYFQDCAVTCQFYCYNYEHMAETLSGVSGVEYDVHDMLAVGAQAQTLARLFNLREGISAEQDTLPERVMKAFSTGPLAGVEITEKRFAWAKRRYYDRMQRQVYQPTSACTNWQ